MITLTALVALLGLGCLVQHLWKRATRAAKALAEADAGPPTIIPARAR